MALSPNSRAVYDYVSEMDGKNITANDIANATGLEVRSINGIVTAAFQRKGLMERVPAEIELEDSTHRAVKFIRLTDAGRAYNPDAEE